MPCTGNGEYTSHLEKPASRQHNAADITSAGVSNSASRPWGLEGALMLISRLTFHSMMFLGAAQRMMRIRVRSDAFNLADRNDRQEPHEQQK